MGILNRKLKIDLNSFCRDYYDYQLFHPISNGEDASQKILDYYFKLLADSEPSFFSVDRDLFETEINALHLELFALAFLDNIHDFEKSVKQSIFTLDYLKQQNRSDIWKAMRDYNLVVAKIPFMDSKGQQMDFSSVTITRINKFRADLFFKWAKTNIKNPDNPTEKEREIAGCAAAVCNRIESNIYSNMHIGNRQLAVLLLQRVGFGDITGEDDKSSADFFSRLASLTLSFYESSSQSLKEVDLKFS